MSRINGHAFEVLIQVGYFVVHPPDFVHKMFECLTFVRTPRIQTLSDPALLRGRQLQVTKVIEHSVFCILEQETASITVQKEICF
jgi:hypothetical protein